MFFSLKVSSFVISNMFLPSIVLLRNAIFKSPSLLRDFHIGIFIQFNTTNMQILIVFETFFFFTFFRVVPENQGSFAMGFQQIFVRCLGFIPAPTLFGTFIDKSCSFWHRDDCTNQTNSCLEYKNYDFRYAATKTRGVFRTLSSISGKAFWKKQLTSFSLNYSQNMLYLRCLTRL